MHRTDFYNPILDSEERGLIAIQKIGEASRKTENAARSAGITLEICSS